MISYFNAYMDDAQALQRENDDEFAEDAISIVFMLILANGDFLCNV